MAEASIHGSMNMFNGDITQRNNNMKSCDNPRQWVPSATINHIPTVEQHGRLQGYRPMTMLNINDRINPDLLKHKSNPYTKI